MKKLLLLITLLLFMTGCSYSSYDYDSSIDYDGSFEDYEDFCNTEYDYVVMTQEAINEVDYENYCKKNDINDSDECLEVFRDEVLEHVSDAFKYVDDYCLSEFGYDILAYDAIDEVNYVGYCLDIGATDETECLENYRDALLSNVSDTFEYLD